MNEEDNEIPSTALFFSKRAKFVPKISPEEFQATSEFVNKLQEEKDDLISDDEAEVPVAKKNKRKVPGQKNQPKSGEITIENIIEEALSSPPMPLSAAAKRRLKKLQQTQDMELKRMEAANQEVLSALDTSFNEGEDAKVENFEKVHVLTISYLSEVLRLKCYEHEKFSTIFPKVADLFKLKISEFLLCLREQNIKVDDTPKSLNILETDIIECIPYKAGENTEFEYDADKLKIFFQTSDRKGKTEILVHKLEKMQDVMGKYSKTQGIPLDELIFEFDGEKISGTDTPEDLDMESGNCIDVRVLTPKKKNSASKASDKKADDPVAVITIEGGSNDSAKNGRRKRNTRSTSSNKQTNKVLDVITIENESNDSVPNKRKRNTRTAAKTNKKAGPVITVESDSDDSEIILCE